MHRHSFTWRWIIAGAFFLGLFSFVALKKNWISFGHVFDGALGKPLVVGMCAAYKPYEFSNEKGEVIGFDVDIAYEIARHLKRPLVIKNMEFGAMILALKYQEIDFIISAMAITPERLETINMIPYYGSSMRSLALVFANSAPEGVGSMQDLQAYPEIHGRQAIIGVWTVTAQADYADKLENLYIRRFDSPMETVMDMQQGKSDAMLSAYDLAHLLQRERPGEFVIVDVPLPEEDWVAGYGIALRKDDTELCEKMKAIITRMKREGFIARAERVWLKDKINRP